MERLAGSRLLRVWERGVGRGPTDRALAILGECAPDVGRDALAGLPIGRRDAWLLDARAVTFGRRLDALVTCPACRTSLAVGLSVDELRPAMDAAPADEAALDAGDVVVDLRLPNSEDLLAAERCSDAATARHLLATRCITSAHRDGSATTLDESLSEDLVAAIATRLASMDPGADTTVSVVCPACDTPWDATLDIAAYLWTEIESEALRLLHEVHRLARGYGWRENDILAMPAVRRQAYLELLPP